MNIKEYLNQRIVSEEVHQSVKSMPKSMGTLGFDPWGYNEESLEISMSFVKWLYEHYFRVKAFGLENIPPQGRAFIVPNHSGQVFPVDAMMIGSAISNNPHGPRLIRSMIERMFPTTPFIGNIANDIGAVLGDPINCIKMLKREECVLVFPEGERGFVKHWKDRYTLQRMGTGFVRIAIETNTPIIPVAVIGCEEISPGLGRLEKLSKWFGLPVLPLALPIALPAQISLYFGKPMHLEGNLDNEEEMVGLVNQVRHEIESLIAQGLKERNGVFR
ncbi:lysophospholipid acyltransferase family protein [Deltaproteobacteria bacterium TL4]